MARKQETKHTLIDGTRVAIRTAEVADAKELRDCVIEYTRDNTGMLWAPGEFKPTVEGEEKWILGMLENPAELLLVAELDGQIVGNIDFHIGARQRLKHAGEFGMSVLPNFRGRGIGALLLQGLIEWSTEVSQIEKINLRVLSTRGC